MSKESKEKPSEAAEFLTVNYSRLNRHQNDFLSNLHARILKYPAYGTWRSWRRNPWFNHYFIKTLEKLAKDDDSNWGKAHRGKAVALLEHAEKQALKNGDPDKILRVREQYLAAAAGTTDGPDFETVFDIPNREQP